jgi:signal transduction histidine kinase
MTPVAHIRRLLALAASGGCRAVPVIAMTLLAVGAQGSAMGAQGLDSLRAGGSRVIVIDAADPLRPGLQEQQRAFIEQLRPRMPRPLDLHVETIDVVRFPGPEMRRSVRDWIARKYAGLPIDVVVAVAPAALEFVLELRQAMGADFAIVALGSRAWVPPSAEASLREAGVSLLLVGDIEGAVVKHALELFPDTRRVVSISDDAARRRPTAELVEAVSDGRARVEGLANLSIREYRDSLAVLGATDLVFYSAVSREPDGTSWIPADALAAMISATDRPVFALTDYLVMQGNGVLGGPTVSYRDLGRLLADRTAEILEGGDPRELPTIEYDNWRWIYDWRQLQRHAVDLGRLPEQAEFVNRPIPFWVSYPYQTAVASGLIAFLLLLIGALSRRGQLLQRARADLLALSERTLWAVDEERARCARDLHDDLCQDLSLIAIEASQLNDPAGALLARKVQDGIARARSIALGLHPAYGPVLGLPYAIEKLKSRVQHLHGITVDVAFSGNFETVSEAQATMLYHIAQEAVANALAHSRATRCDIRCSVEPGALRLEVEDNGVGMPAEWKQLRGIGILSMRERARAVGGRLEIVAGAAGGTLLQVTARPQISAVPQYA